MSDEKKEKEGETYYGFASLTNWQCHFFVFLGYTLTSTQLEEVSELSGVLDVPSDYLDPEVRTKCESILPYPSQIENNHWVEAFLLLKQRFHNE